MECIRSGVAAQLFVENNIGGERTPLRIEATAEVFSAFLAMLENVVSFSSPVSTHYNMREPEGSVRAEWSWPLLGELYWLVLA